MSKECDTLFKKVKSNCEASCDIFVFTTTCENCCDNFNEQIKKCDGTFGGGIIMVDEINQEMEKLKKVVGLDKEAKFIKESEINNEKT